jgi:GT2 family glycosyltransferase
MKRYTHFRRSQLNGVVEVDLTGAVMLIHRSLYKKAIYKFDSQGEDIPFCRDIKRLGEKIYCDCDLKLAHCMNLELLEKYKIGEFKF